MLKELHGCGGRKAAAIKSYNKAIMSKSMSVLDYLLHHSTASSSILVALAVGIFTILTLFTQVAIGSFAWIVLSITYVFTCIAGILIFRNWAVAEILLRHFSQENTGDTEVNLHAIVGESKIRKMFFFEPFANKDTFYLAALIVIVFLAIIIWAAFAFQLYH
ncbi:hypothetical protein [Nitrososphaera viennensis]|uniref:Uncharacterized protein n=2 Tax=Nitrososphaera viennensis TaxID=1034015 RepID=A0A060HJG9_9ARCH|nr:hypothetical protein [Nitrososphaera viennensis]AIC15673.1 membrane protein of unknown function [Nitrososphaera viennensis EN76]UVS70546.1 hypothetical protein NWT39_07110 [Nitrososphaera viennensis]